MISINHANDVDKKVSEHVNKIDKNFAKKWARFKNLKIFLLISFYIVLLFIPFGSTNGVYTDTTLDALISFFLAVFTGASNTLSIVIAIAACFYILFGVFLCYSCFNIITVTKPTLIKFTINVIGIITVGVLGFIFFNETFSNLGIAFNLFSLFSIVWSICEGIFIICRLIFLKNFPISLIRESFIIIMLILSIFANIFMFPVNSFNPYANIKNHDTFSKFELGESVVFNNDKWDPDNFVEGTHTVYFYTHGYEYWNQKKEALEQKALTLKPESISEDDLKKYLEQLNYINEEVSKIESITQTLIRESVKITTKRWKETTSNGFGYGTKTKYHNDILEILYNAAPENETKWNNKENSRLFCNQSITLTQTEFEHGTDFSNIELGATIKYYDGSVKKSFINIENVSELNNANRGTHLLKWSDSWGNYEYEITIA